MDVYDRLLLNTEHNEKVEIFDKYIIVLVWLLLYLERCIKERFYTINTTSTTSTTFSSNGHDSQTKHGFL